jgi:uncharacterized membrane protein
MTARRSILRLALVFAVVMLSALRLTGSADAQTAKSFQLTSLNVDATVSPDGSMLVTEDVTYNFSGGPFTFAFRTFKPAWFSRIENFAATEQGAPLPVESGVDRWTWRYAPTSDSTHTYQLTYRVVGAVDIGSDVGELYWQFIGTDHPGVASMNVHINLPGEYPVAAPTTADDDITVVRAWAHGPLNGKVQPSARGVDLSVTGVPQRTFVEGRIVIPLTAFNAPGTTARLPKILREEKGYLNTGKTGRKAATILAPLATLAGLLGFGALWRKHGKEPAKPDYIGDYWREPLTDPPAVVYANLNFGKVEGRAMASTLVDLAQRGYLSITEHESKRFGRSKDIYTFTATNPKARVGAALPPPLSPWESDLLANVFQGQHETTSQAFEDWAKANQITSAKFWNEWKMAVSTDMKSRGYVETGRAGVWLTALGIIAAMILTGIVLISVSKNRVGSVSPIGGLCIAAGVIMAMFLPTLRKRTSAGAEEQAQALALKKYLQDFSNMKDAPVDSLIVWERFLVYAVVLGVASHVIRGLAVKLPAVVNNPGFAPWFIPIGGRGDMGSSMDNFPGSWGSAATSAMTPANTSSGSGGGFSGGGGGGGGGGGFGAG